MTKEELDQILNSFDWIKVRRFDETVSAMNAYDELKFRKLIQHHNSETDFLIKKVREMAQRIYELESQLD